MRISSADMAAFENDGALALRGVFDSPDIARLASAIADDMREPGPLSRL